MTSFARRQRAATPITKDGEHLDHAADGVHEQPQEPIIDDVCADVQDFLGRSHDTSVLTDYVYHCWIKEHFPIAVSSIAVEDYHEIKSCACHWKSGKALPVSTHIENI
ncbi:hypothetical protein HKD37_16G044538 [Glycine soja]